MRLFKYLAALACIFSLLACSNIGSNLPWNSSQNFDESNQSIAELLGDMPIPNGAQIQNENTLIIGKGVGWVGRVNLSAMQSSNEVYSFFLADFPKAGWSVISATKSKTSIMVATKDDRTCTVEVSDGPFAGPKTVISITSSPKNAPVSTKAK
jgi:hypothetical protein